MDKPNGLQNRKGDSHEIDVFDTFEAAESYWAWTSNRRHEREGHWVEPSKKEDVNSKGKSIRYYILHYYGEEVMIKTTIAEKTVL